MREIKKSDVIVVGAGVGGSYLGHLLASNGINVTIAEKSKDYKIDSGIVSNGIFNFMKIDEKLIKQKIKRMKLFFGNREFEISSKKPFAIILNRKNFGRYLREMANNSGTKIIYDEVFRIRIKNNEIEAIGRENRYIGKVLVGADGANSIVRRCLGISSPNLYLGFICKYLKNNAKENRDIIVYHNKRYSKRFFAWKINANRELGLITELSNCERNINNFLFDIKKEEKVTIRDKYYNLIPFGTTKSYGKRSILLGDACGQVKPLTGGGIIYSLICAKKAFEVIKEFLERDDEKIIKKYESLCKREIGREIWFQERLRDLYEKLSQRDIEKIASKINDLQFDEIDYDNSISIAKKILFQESKIELIKMSFLFFKYLFC